MRTNIKMRFLQISLGPESPPGVEHAIVLITFPTVTTLGTEIKARHKRHIRQINVELLPGPNALHTRFVDYDKSSPSDIFFCETLYRPCYDTFFELRVIQKIPPEQKPAPERVSEVKKQHTS